MKILIDSSFYISLAYPTDTNHRRAQTLVPKYLNYNKSTTEDFVKETLTTISQRLGKQQAIASYEEMRKNTDIIHITREYFEAGLHLFLNPKRQKDISLTDCIACIVAQDKDMDAILTFDRHFRSLGLTVLPRS